VSGGAEAAPAPLRDALDALSALSPSPAHALRPLRQMLLDVRPAAARRRSGRVAGSLAVAWGQRDGAADAPDGAAGGVADGGGGAAHPPAPAASGASPEGIPLAAALAALAPSKGLIHVVVVGEGAPAQRAVSRGRGRATDPAAWFPEHGRHVLCPLHAMPKHFHHSKGSCSA
jgi:hypothetical protein